MANILILYMLVGDIPADNAEKHTPVGYKNRAMKHELSLKLRLIYVFRVNYEACRVCRKIVETTFDYEIFMSSP